MTRALSATRISTVTKVACFSDIRSFFQIYVTCKNIQTHEIRKTSLKDIKLWKQSTDSKLLNKKPLRSWKILHNKYRGSSKKAIQTEDDEERGDTNVEIVTQGSDCPYTMRRSGLHILSDPQGNLFYAPIAELKARTIPITY